MGVLTEVILVRKYMFDITYMVAGVFTYCCLCTGVQTATAERESCSRYRGLTNTDLPDICRVLSVLQVQVLDPTSFLIEKM